MKRKRGPLDDIGGAKELANYRLSVAKEDLADAERNFEEKRYRNANNRATMLFFTRFPPALRWSSRRSRAMRR